MKQETKVKAQFRGFLKDINNPNGENRPKTYQHPIKPYSFDAPFLELDSESRTLSRKISYRYNNNLRIESETSPNNKNSKDPTFFMSQTQNKWQDTIEAIDRKTTRHILAQESLSPNSHSPMFFTGDDVFTIENDEKREEREKNLKKLQKIKMQNKYFQKKSVLELVSMFSNSSTDSPTVIFDPRSPTRNNQRASTDSTNLQFRESRDLYGLKQKTKATLVPPLKKEELNLSVEKNANHYVPIEQIIPTLVDISQLKFHETLFVKYYSEFPKIKSIDWDKIINELQTTKLEIYVIDPIFFVIEGYYELPINGSSSIHDKIQYCVRELSAFNNEAKHVLVSEFNTNY